MFDEEETKLSGEEEKRIKRKSLEASVTLGLGYGQKKKQHVKAFFSACWPVLQGAGWTLVSEFVRVGLGHGLFGFRYAFKIDFTLQEIFKGIESQVLVLAFLQKSTTRLIRCAVLSPIRCSLLYFR
jgi:hypothetical protein